MAKVVGYVAVLLFLSACSVAQDETRSGLNLTFHTTPQSSEKLILLVHGIFGDPASTWTNRNGRSWMDLMKDDSDFRNFTVATIRYDTPFLSRASTIEEAASRSLGRLQDEAVFRKYDEIYFIAHSMGGLLVKRMLVELNHSRQPESCRRVRAVLYISTPAQGANLADLGSWLSINPQLRDMRQADLNSFMQSLENDWQNLIRGRDSRRVPRSYCAYETKPTYGTMVVNRLYAATICDENPVPIDENHSTIVKPLNRQADIYVWARARIQDAAAAPLEVQRADASTTMPAPSVQVNTAPYGIAIAGGIVNNPTVNNYGPKKLPELSSNQQEIIRSRLQSFQGRSVHIQINQPTTEDMRNFGVALEGALGRHMRVTRSEAMLLGGCAATPGVSFMVGVNRIVEAKLLWELLVEIDIQDGKMPYCSRPGEPDEFNIRIFGP